MFNPIQISFFFRIDEPLLIANCIYSKKNVMVFDIFYNNGLEK